MGSVRRDDVTAFTLPAFREGIDEPPTLENLAQLEHKNFPPLLANGAAELAETKGFPAGGDGEFVFQGVEFPERAGSGEGLDHHGIFEFRFSIFDL